MHRARLVQLFAACALALGPVGPVSAQGVPTATTTGATGGTTGAVTFRCPGVTDISAGADPTALSRLAPTSTVTVPALSPADAAESPCILADAAPEIDWSSDYTALRMTAPGTWQLKMRAVLADFDTLHGQYVANPRIKDMGMWPARLEESLQLTSLLAHQSGRDVVIYYAAALRDEYKAGIYDERPLLTTYGLQARAKLEELASPPPTPTPHPRSRR